MPKRMVPTVRAEIKQYHSAQDLCFPSIMQKHGRQFTNMSCVLLYKYNLYINSHIDCRINISIFIMDSMRI